MRQTLFLFALFLISLSPAAPCLAAPAVNIQDEADDATPELSEEAADAIEGAANSEEAGGDEFSDQLVDPQIPELELEHRLVPLTREELARLADEWLAIVRVKTEEVMQAEIAIDRSEGEVKEEVRTALADMIFERNELFDRFSQVLGSWERKAAGAEEDLARIAEYRAYRDAVSLDEIRTSEFQTLFAEAQHWFVDPEGGVALALTSAAVLISIAGLFLLARLIEAGVDRALNRFGRLSTLMRGFLTSAVFWIVMTIGVIVALSMIGMDITPLFAVIGAASFILAFAFQETLGNLASGFMIILNRPFDEGDTVEIDGVSGIVRSVSLVATKIVTFDNQVILVPNRNVWGTIIKNLTASDTRRVDLVFGIGYGDSIEDATRVLEEVTSGHPAVLAEPGPVIRVNDLGESSVNFICRPWVKTADYWTVYWDLTQQVKKAFDQRGISIPFPQRDLHVHLNQAGDAQSLIPKE